MYMVVVWSHGVRPCDQQHGTCRRSTTAVWQMSVYKEVCCVMLLHRARRWGSQLKASLRARVRVCACAKPGWHMVVRVDKACYRYAPFSKSIQQGLRYWPSFLIALCNQLYEHHSKVKVKRIPIVQVYNCCISRERLPVWERVPVVRRHIGIAIPRVIAYASVSMCH